MQAGPVSSVGAYGKMPGLGDFFRIGLPPSFTDPWDAWVQRGMTAGREALGARWQDCYMTAPIWRFTLSPGLAGPHAVQGVLMASVDRVGRQFPLTLARLLPGQPDIRAAHAAAADWFAALEDIALDALDDAMTRDALTDRLRALDMPPAPVPLGRGSRLGVWAMVLGGEARQMAIEGLPSPGQMRAFFDLDAPSWHAIPANGASA